MNAVAEPLVIPSLANVTLQPGEHFAGLVREAGTWHGLIFTGEYLPAANFAKQQAHVDGDRHVATSEEAHICRANLNDVIEAGSYWTSTQYELLDDYAYVQGFGRWGGQFLDHKSSEHRAFVVRRVIL